MNDVQQSFIDMVKSDLKKEGLELNSKDEKRILTIFNYYEYLRKCNQLDYLAFLLSKADK